MIPIVAFFVTTVNAQELSVILSEEQTKAVWGKSGTPTWTPDEKSIAALESRLEPYIRSHPYTPAGDYQSVVVANALKYRRQYMGITRNRRRLIYLNAFCEYWRRETEIPDWKKKIVQADGGGSCFFRVLFDPKTNQFSGLNYNAVK
jgi:hypothetical protein